MSENWRSFIMKSTTPQSVNTSAMMVHTSTCTFSFPIASIESAKSGATLRVTTTAPVVEYFSASIDVASMMAKSSGTARSHLHASFHDPTLRNCGKQHSATQAKSSWISVMVTGRFQYPMISLFTRSIEELQSMKKITAQITSPFFLISLIDIHPPKRVRSPVPTASCSSFSSGSGLLLSLAVGSALASAEEAPPIVERAREKKLYYRPPTSPKNLLRTF